MKEGPRLAPGAFIVWAGRIYFLRVKSLARAAASEVS